MNFVVDCSVTMSWIFEDESSQKSDELLNLILDGATVIVPTIWRYEVSNVLLLATIKKRISGYKNAISLLGKFPIKEDPFSIVATWGDTLQVAAKTNLTIYDASYLETAKRNLLPLATFDKAMIKAAKSLKIPLLT